MRPSRQRLQALRDYYLDNGDDWVDGEGDVADLFTEIDTLEAHLARLEAALREIADGKYYAYDIARRALALGEEA